MNTYLFVVEDRLYEPLVLARNGWARVQEINTSSMASWEKTYFWTHPSSLGVQMMVREKSAPVNILLDGQIRQYSARSMLEINPLKTNIPEANAEAVNIYLKLLAELRQAHATVFHSWKIIPSKENVINI